MASLFPALGKAILAFLTKLLLSVASEKFIEWFFFFVAEKYVASTTRTDDDEILLKIKESYESYKGGK
ncbi:hypothetical protein S1R3Y_000045 [Vibrio phage vB_ValP_VA-RY-3]|nr:hypothetical protein S1R3Y_000045 [Vibrio phage vB_ValP_VA-RY-3]